MPLFTTAVATVATLVLAACGGCTAPAPNVRLHWLPPYKLAAPESPTPRDETTPVVETSVALSSAINQTVSFCFVIDGIQAPIERPAIRVAPIDSMDGRLDSDAFEVFRMHRVGVGALPGWHIRSIPPDERNLAPGDALVPIGAPRGGLPFRMEPGQSYHFWVDVRVPKATNAGVYSTAVEIESSGRRLARLPVELTVEPIMLPDESDFVFFVDLDHHKLFEHMVGTASAPYARGIDDWRIDPHHDDCNNCLWDTMRLLRAHGVTPVLNKLAPVTKMAARSGVALDWGQYDEIVTPCLDGTLFPDRVGLPIWPIPPLQNASGMFASSRSSQEQIDRVTRDYLADCARHFAQNGWLARSYWLPPIHRPPGEALLSQERRLAELANVAHPGLRVFSRSCPQDLSAYGWAGFRPGDPGGAIRGWLTSAQFFDPSVMRQERSQGLATWLALADPPFSGSIHIAAPPSYTRMLGWMARAVGAESIYLGCVNDWPAEVANPTPTMCVAHDPGTLIYPGRAFGLDEAIASVRLKRVRDAVYDLAYAKLLDERQLGHLSAALGDALVAYAGADAYRTHYADGRRNGWVDDVQQFDRAREIMTEAVVRAASPGSAPEGHSLESTVTWQRLMRGPGRVHLEVDGCNARFTGTATSWSAELVCTVTVTNRTRLPLSGRLRFAEVPPTWGDVAEGRVIESVPPNQSHRAVLTATADAIPSRTGGYFELPIELLADDGRLFTTSARVSFVTALPFAGTINVDGDLSDWPPGSINMLGDFRLITQDVGTDSQTHPTHPLSRTFGFVLQDEKYLYVAVNSILDPSRARDPGSCNAVSYDGITPVGDDLVEILIDPLNSGTRSPTDLYHVVVKPSGIYLAEHGIGLDPPVGDRYPWAADLEVGSRVVGDRWTVELRIPWRSFEDALRRNSVWGLNVTRFDLGAQQYSNWSGATGNTYDPMSLGNVFVPAIPGQGP